MAVRPALYAVWVNSAMIRLNRTIFAALSYAIFQGKIYRNKDISIRVSCIG